MRVLAEIEVQTTYCGPQKINDVNIFAELDEHKNTGWKVDGVNGSTHYHLGYHYDKSQAIDQFSKIKCRLLRAKETEAESWQ